MRILILLLVTSCVALGVVPAWADQITISLDQRMNAQTNPTRDPEGGPADGTYSIRPGIEIRDARDRLNYHVGYKPTFETYFQFGDATGWDQNAWASLDYNFSPADSIALSGRFTDTRSVASDFVGDVGDPEDAGLAIRGRVKRFDVMTNYSHSFTPRLSGRGGATFEMYDFSQANRTNSLGLLANASMRYLARENLYLGMGMSGSYRTFEATQSFPESDSATLNVNAIIESELTETISFEVQAGPLAVFSRNKAIDTTTVLAHRNPNDDTLRVWNAGVCFDPTVGAETMSNCGLLIVTPPTGADLTLFNEQATIGYDPGQNPGETSDSDLTYFMTASLRKRLDRGELRVYYERREDVSVGLGPATIVDRVGFRSDWRPYEKWRGVLSLEWKNRESRNEQNIPLVGVVQGPPSSSVPGQDLALADRLIPNIQSNLVDQTTVHAGAHLMRQITDRWTAGVIFRYVYQLANRSDTGEDRDYDNIVTSFQVTYEFEPFTF